jgi:hypothetical protein
VTDIRVERGISLEFCSKIWSCQGFVVTLQGLIEIVMTVIELNAQLLRELSYKEYEKGWDGDDALPLSRQVVKNFKAVLQKSRDSELEGWTFFHSSNGTLLLQNKERKSGINIGSRGYSYYEIVDGEVKGENNLRFSPKSVIETMKRI